MIVVVYERRWVDKMTLLQEFSKKTNSIFYPAKAFTDIKEKYLYFISRSEYIKPVKRQAAIDGASLLEIDDLFLWA